VKEYAAFDSVRLLIEIRASKRRLCRARLQERKLFDEFLRYLTTFGIELRPQIETLAQITSGESPRVASDE
jgi:hypothetical protein